MDPEHIPEMWLLQPDLFLWPPKRHRAVLWIIAHMAVHRTTYDRTLTTHDYIDFLRRAKWKLDAWHSRMRLVGNYLSVLEL
jgi:hypothetical protein